MLHTPLKRAHAPAVPVHGHAHAPAQHAQSASTRCSPHSVHGNHASLPSHAHELNIADWLHMSPAQVAMMSPVAAPYTPPNHLFIPTPSPLQYVPAANGRNDFLTTSPLPYSSPFQVPAAPYPQPNPYGKVPDVHSMQVPSIYVSVENAHQLQDPLAQAQPGDGSSPGATDANMLLSLSSEYFPYANGSGPNSSAATSPVEHGGSPFPFHTYMGPMGEGESTPVTTLSGTDESQAKTQASSQADRPVHAFIERLRGASPDTDVSVSVSHSPERPAKSQVKPVESIESPFCIAAPQPRAGSGLISPLPLSSRPSSGLGALSELAELASQRSTPLAPSSRVSPAPQSRTCSRPVSRPASALSVRSNASHTRPSKIQRKKLPHRFAPSPLQVHLHYQMSISGGSDVHASCKQLSPSLVDGLPRGPLEFEEEGHRYRTRSKLRSLKAEIQEREREADLALIRRGLRGETANSGAGAEDQGGLEMLASVSATRRIELDSPKRTGTPSATRVKTGMKRVFRDLDDGDYDSATDGSVSGSRTPSKRPRIATEKVAVSAKTMNKLSGNTPARTRKLREKAPARPSPMRTAVQQTRKATTPSNNAAKKGTPVRKVEEMEIDESELSSLSGLSETEDAKSTSADDADYAPKKIARTRSKSASASASVVRAASAKSASKTAPSKAKATPINTAGGAAAINFPVRTFPPEVQIHSAFSLFYRKFPVCGYTDPNSFAFTSFGDASPPASLSRDNVKSEGHDDMPPVPSTGHFNSPRSAEDLYTPRFVRGVGRDKMGLCPICYESPERGGNGRAEWLSMKFSAFNYHMQYAHGISPVTALPFSPPIAFRSVPRTPNHKNEKNEILEGKCHRCQEWAAVEGVKCVEAKLKEIYWWKHAAACHKGSNIPGERDAHVEDAVSKRVRAVFDFLHPAADPTMPALPKFSASPSH